MSPHILVDGEFLMNVGKLFGQDDQKELVDPYCVVSYAGHSGRTPTVMENMNPEWNMQINLGVRVRVMHRQTVFTCPHIHMYVCTYIEVNSHSDTLTKQRVSAIHCKCGICSSLKLLTSQVCII